MRAALPCPVHEGRSRLGRAGITQPGDTFMDVKMIPNQEGFNYEAQIELPTSENSVCDWDTIERRNASEPRFLPF